MPFVTAQGKRILFIHIPRTGGTTIENALKTQAPLNFWSIGVPAFSHVTPQHYTMTDIRNLFDEDFFDYAFTIVRNPYDRLESRYKLEAVLNKRGFWGGAPAFSHWLEASLESTRRQANHADNHLRPQCDFLGSKLKVFRFEDGLESILETVNAETGAGLKLPSKRYYSTEAFQDPFKWDLQDLIQVNRFYADDFKLLQYDMRTEPSPT